MRRVLVSLTGLLLCLALSPASAQGLRDPTLPPAEAGVPGAPASGTSMRLEPGSSSVIVRNGRPYLVVGTRLYAQGEKLGQARIERITETEVWLREAGQLRKIARFGGIERHPAAAPAANAGCAKGSLTKRPPVKMRKVSKKTSQTPKASRARKPGRVANKPASTAPLPETAPCVDGRP